VSGIHSFFNVAWDNVDAHNSSVVSVFADARKKRMEIFVIPFIPRALLG
jgi:hypothetical protein